MNVASVFACHIDSGQGQKPVQAPDPTSSMSALQGMLGAGSGGASNPQITPPQEKTQAPPQWGQQGGVKPPGSAYPGGA